MASPDSPVDQKISIQHAEQFFAVSLDLLCVAGYDGYFKYLNPTWSQTLGYSVQELLSSPYLSFVHSDDQDRTRLQAEQLTAGGRAMTFENRYRCKDGSYKWLLWNAIAAPPDQVIYATARDITEHKRKERRLAAQYAVARLLSETSSFEQAVPKLLQAIGDTVGWGLGVMWTVDRTANLLRCANIWSSPSVHVPEFEGVTGVMTFPPGIGLPGRVWKNGAPAWIPDTVRDKNFPRMPFAASSGLHGAFGFPVICGGEVTGVIEFFSREVENVDDDLLNMIGALGLQIGQFLARKRAEDDRERVIVELREALSNVKTLSGLLPICSSCKKIRDDKGYWNRLEDYILAHSEAHITHGLCTDCARKMHPDWDQVP